MTLRINYLTWVNVKKTHGVTNANNALSFPTGIPSSFTTMLAPSSLLLTVTGLIAIIMTSLQPRVGKKTGRLPPNPPFFPIHHTRDIVET